MEIENKNLNRINTAIETHFFTRLNFNRTPIIMNKKKYVAPACECIVLNSVTMLASSVIISNQVTGSDAVMSNTNRHDNFGLRNFDW